MNHSLVDEFHNASTMNRGPWWNFDETMVYCLELPVNMYNVAM